MNAALIDKAPYNAGDRARPGRKPFALAGYYVSGCVVNAKSFMPAPIPALEVRAVPLTSDL